jgi:hypothetical protein
VHGHQALRRDAYRCEWQFSDLARRFSLGGSTGLRVEPFDDAVGGAENALSGGRHDRRRVLTVGLFCPLGDVRERVVAGFNADVSTYEVGDGFGLDLDDASAVPGRAVFSTWIVQPDMAELVSKRLQCLGVIDVVADADDALRKVGVSVGAGAVATLNC